MANFLRPKYEPATAFAEKPNGLAHMTCRSESRATSHSVGRAPDGEPLWVQFNDFDSSACPAKCVEKKTAGSQYRFFTITPRPAKRALAVALSDDGQLALIGSEGGTVQLWKTPPP